MTRTSQRLVVTVIPAELPTYLQDVPANQWVQVASDASAKIAAVAPSPAVSIPNYSTDGQLDSWTGGCVDQTTKQLIRPANGGHTSYLGNENYAINLAANAPVWERLNDPTSNAVLEASRSRLFPTEPNGDALNDGRTPSLHHGGELQYQDGRVWITFQTSTAGDDGNLPNRTTGFNGNWVIPAAWSWERATNTWRQHGKVHPSWLNHAGFGKSAALSTQQLVFGFPNAYDNWYCEIDTRPGISESARLTRREATVSLGTSKAWAVGCPELNIVVVGLFDTDQIAILNRNVGVNAWEAKTAAHSFHWDEVTQQAASLGKFNVSSAFNAQPVFHPASNSLLFFEANYNTTGMVRQLRIPTASGAYDPAGTWSWSSFATTGAPVGANVGGQSTYGRFNIIHDLGGVSVLVCHPSATSPVYVCRLGYIG